VGLEAYPSASGYLQARAVCDTPAVPVERATDHPTFDAFGNTVVSYAAPSRGSDEAALFRTDIPPGSGLPPHRHDHFDVFAVVEGSATVHIGGSATEVTAGDSVVILPGDLHWLDAGPDGVSLIVTMYPRTKLIREADGVEMVPPWVS
jgi:quercetin dioxygenase-like cupin family protein